jgi:hypothetical protein
MEAEDIHYTTSKDTYLRTILESYKVNDTVIGNGDETPEARQQVSPARPEARLRAEGVSAGKNERRISFLTP